MSATPLRAVMEATLGPEEVERLIGELCGARKRGRRAILEFILHQLGSMDLNALRAHTGMLLALLARHDAPHRELVDLLVAMTDSSVISTRRLRFVVTLARRNPAWHHLQRLARAWRQRASCHVYVPPLEQKHILDARIPLGCIQVLSRDNLAETSNIHTLLYKHLIAASAVSDISTADALAGIAPLISAVSQVPLGVEQFIYEYLGARWKGKRTQTLLVIVHYFRWWPSHSKSRKILLGLLANAEPPAAAAIVAHLYHFGSDARSLVKKYTRSLIFSGYNVPVAHTGLYQFWAVSNLEPPGDFVVALIVCFPGYLLLCNNWAHLAPDICLALQGMFANDILTALWGKNGADARFALVNSPWVGTFPRLTLGKLLASIRPMDPPPVPYPPLILPEWLSDQGVSIAKLSRKIVSDLESAGMPITNYLLPVADSDESEQD